MQQIVQKVPAGVCEAFFGALEAAVATCTGLNAEHAVKLATDQLKRIQIDPEYLDTLLSKVVNLQALILMAVATDNLGPSYDQKSFWISLAVDVATSMKLHLPSHVVDPNGRDSFTRGDLGRRAWLILYILDRWHAVGQVGMLRISESNCELVEYDRELMGEDAFQMFRK